MISNDEWVALKILIALTEQEKASKEMRVLRDLLNDSTTGDAYVVQLLDQFCHKGPNGSHHCLVFELLGPSLDSVIESYRPFPWDVATVDNRLDSDVILRVSKQLLSALSSLHGKGIAHGGKNFPAPLQACAELTIKDQFADY